jgi:ShK domain-like
VAVDTHTHPNWAVHPVTGDRYAPYNKPASIVHWLEHAQPTAEYVIILDADMVIRKPMTVELVGAAPGKPVSAHYGYLVGIFDDHHMGVKSRVKFASPPQQVGGFSVMHIDDLRRVAPRWLYWTEEVRRDPDSWGNTGDIFNQNGKAGPPWIAEMYGYVFACAEAGLVFTVSEDFMLYPGYQPPSPDPWPLVMHYGVTYNIDWYAFDKHWYMMTDMTSCPGRMFQKPPTTQTLGLEPGTLEHRRADVALSVAWGLYNATRQHVISACGIADPPDPPQARYRCNTGANSVVVCMERAADDIDPPPPPAVKAIAADVPVSSPPPAVQTQQAAARLRGAVTADGVAGATKPKSPAPCVDAVSECCLWARQGDCTLNAGFMHRRCPRACGVCGPGAGKAAGVACDDAGGADTPVRAKTAPVAISDLERGRQSAVISGGDGDDVPVVEVTGAVGVDREHIDPAEKPQHTTPDRVIKPHEGQTQAHAAGQQAHAQVASAPSVVQGVASEAGIATQRGGATAAEEKVNPDLELMQRLSIPRTGGLGDAVWSEMDEQFEQRTQQRQHFEVVALWWGFALLGLVAAVRAVITRRRGRTAGGGWRASVAAPVDDRKGV